jgi:hypothetical protein
MGELFSRKTKAISSPGFYLEKFEGKFCYTLNHAEKDKLVVGGGNGFMVSVGRNWNGLFFL